MNRKLATALILLPLVESSCAHVDRNAATTLAESGVKVSSALADGVEKRSDRIAAVRQIEGFNGAFDQFSNSAPGSLSETGSGTDGCDVVVLANEQATSPISKASARLAEIVLLRAEAVRALGKAYQALADEAAFDQPGEVDKAIAPAAEAADKLATVLGQPLIGAILKESGKVVARALAVNAQSRRILAGSRKIAVVTASIRRSLVAERDRFTEIEGLVQTSAAGARQRLLRAGVLDTAVAVKSVAQRVGAPLAEGKLAAAISADPALRGAAEVTTLNSHEQGELADLDAAIEALSGLQALHVRLEEGKRLDPEQVDSAVDRLQSLVGLMGK
jgi:hypothetical protein